MAQHHLNFVQGVVGAPLPPVKKYLSVRQNVQQIVNNIGNSNFVIYLHRCLSIHIFSIMCLQKINKSFVLVLLYFSIDCAHHLPHIKYRVMKRRGDEMSSDEMSDDEMSGDEMSPDHNC